MAYWFLYQISLAEFEKVLAATLSPNNQLRKSAESTLEKIRSNPEAFVSLLVMALKDSKVSEVL